MPIDKYFGGNGSEVMSNMAQQYGPDQGKSVFYATANKRGQNPGESPKKSKANKIKRIKSARGKRR